MKLDELATPSGHPDARALRIFRARLWQARSVGLSGVDAYQDALDAAVKDWRERHEDALQDH
jgi:hypothetical protein